MSGPVDSVKTLYDALAPFYRKLVAMDEREILTIQSKLPATPGRALDLGCGVGRVAVPLAMAGWRVHGLDLSSEMLAQAAVYSAEMGVSDRVGWTIADFSDPTSWPAGKFDLVIAIGSLFHITEEAALERILHAVSACLRPDGLFVFDIETEQSAWISEPDEQECIVNDRILLIRKNGAGVECVGRSWIDLTVQLDGDLTKTVRMQTVWSGEEAFRLRLTAAGFEVLDVQSDWGAAGVSGLLVAARHL